MAEFWQEAPNATYSNEASVEHLFVLPLLEALGYEKEDIAPKFPVRFHEGRKGRPSEADFAVFDGGKHGRDTSLLVVEAKSPSEQLDSGRSQAESYATWLRAPLYVVTNGISLEVWQYQLSRDSTCVLGVTVRDLARDRGKMEALLSKRAVREYCGKLCLKTIAIHAQDLSEYERAETRRFDRTKYYADRTLTSGVAQTRSVDAIRSFRPGALILGPSGFGKSCLAATIVAQSLGLRRDALSSKLPIDVPLPDLSVSKLELEAFASKRISAYCPGVTADALRDILRVDGAVVVCDSYDRVAEHDRGAIETALRNFCRDYPLAQVFVFSRPIARPDLPLPQVSLAELSPEEQLAFARLHGEQMNWESSLHYHWLSPFLRRYSAHPLFLRLILDHWGVHGAAPSDLNAVFRSWLHNLLSRDTQRPSVVAQREVGLTALAVATSETAIDLSQAMGVVAAASVPASTLDDLVDLGAARVHAGLIELEHEALGDYLRAREFAGLDATEIEVRLRSADLRGDSAFSVLLAAVLPARSLPKTFWSRLVQTGLPNYLSALRYRGNAAEDLLQLPPPVLCKRFLQDVAEGLDSICSHSFPQLRDRVVANLTGSFSTRLGIRGQLEDAATIARYQYVGLETPDAPIADAISVPPSIARMRNLPASGLRVDCGRAIGAEDLRRSLEALLGVRDLVGARLWRMDRLTSRVRYLGYRLERPDFVHLALRELERALMPVAGRGVPRWNARGALLIDEVLADLHDVLDDGATHLDLWWDVPRTRQPEAQAYHWTAAFDDAAVEKLIKEHFRRTQLLYRELVEGSFAEVAAELFHFPGLPACCHVTVVPTQTAAIVEPILYLDWRPVSDWRYAEASVTFSSVRPQWDPEKAFEEVREVLKQLGRPVDRFPLGGWTGMPSFDGWHVSCRFDGETSALREACEMLERDIRFLFEPLGA